MEAIKTSSSYEILQRVASTFRIPNSNWHADAIEWIADGIKDIGYHTGFVPKDDIFITIENYTAKVPDEVQSLNGIYLNGCRLPLMMDRSNVNFRYIKNYTNYSLASDYNVNSLNDEYKRLRELQTMYEETPTDEILDAIMDSQRKISVLVENLTFIKHHAYLNCEWCGIEGGYFKTSFPSGTIRLDANCYMVDDKGFPLVVDTQKYKFALEWGIIYKLMLQGWVHPVVSFEFAYNEYYSVRIPMAQNEPKMMSPEREEAFTYMWNSVKRDSSETIYVDNITNVTTQRNLAR